MKIMIKVLRKTVIILWIFLIIYFGYYFSSHRELLVPKNLFIFFQSFGPIAIIVYIIASFVRWLVLLPSLPLVFVGVLFFPGNPHLVFLISMLGIIFSGILIYQFSEFLWFDEMFAENIDNIKVKKAIEKYGFFAVLIWSFVPLVPTDLICYAAGTVRMNFWKFVWALALGEWVIVGLIVYGGKEILNLL